MYHWSIVRENQAGPARHDPFEIGSTTSLKYQLYICRWNVVTENHKSARIDPSEVGTPPFCFCLWGDTARTNLETRGDKLI